jgi:biotin operon repressor
MVTKKLGISNEAICHRVKKLKRFTILIDPLEIGLSIGENKH